MKARGIGPSSKASMQGSDFLKVVDKKLLWYLQVEAQDTRDANKDVKLYGPDALTLLLTWVDNVANKGPVPNSLEYVSKLETYQYLLGDASRKNLTVAKAKINVVLKQERDKRDAAPSGVAAKRSSVTEVGVSRRIARKTAGKAVVKAAPADDDW